MREWLSLSLGLMAAIAVICSQSFSYSSYLLDQKVEQTTDLADSGEDQHDVTTISKDAVSSFVQVTLAQGLHFITNIYQCVEDAVDFDIDLKIDYNAYFKTLFRLIISPNAP